MQPVVATQAAKYEYMPNDFMVLSLITVILCGIFSPLSLVLSLPALYYSQQVSTVHGYILFINQIIMTTLVILIPRVRGIP